MGKIFEALEKANREFHRTLPISRKDARTSDDAVDKDKVVPLLSPNKYNEERQLDPNLITHHSPQSIESELFKVLRTNLLYPSAGSVPKTILVTSALPGDGKSLVSANLAISIAQGVEEHVLLIDCDIRKPSIHSMFGHHQVIGLSEYLSQDRDLSNFILKTPVEKLSIISGGSPPANPAELLSSKKMKALIKDVSGRYEDRFVIIDSPPPSMAAETTAIANLVDGVIVVVKNGKTPRNAVTELVEQIGKEKLLGVVLNFFDQSIKKYYGYRKSYDITNKNNSE